MISSTLLPRVRATCSGLRRLFRPAKVAATTFWGLFLCRQSLKKSQNWLFTTDEREMALLRDTYVAGEECLPESCLTEPEKRSLALRTISLLPPEQRICMILRYVAQLKPHQIAKIMEVDELTVLGRLNSGRRALLTTLPDPAPKALLTELFSQEAAALPVPELLRDRLHMNPNLMRVAGSAALAVLTAISVTYIAVGSYNPFIYFNV